MTRYFYLLFLYAIPQLCLSQSIQNLLQIAGGYLAGHVIHESGHALSAYSVGASWRLKSTSSLPYVLFTHSSVEGVVWKERVIASGGFLAEVTASEIILSSSSLRTESGSPDYFLIGILAMTVINPVGYTWRDEYELKHYSPQEPLRIITPSFGRGMASTIATLESLRKAILQQGEENRVRGYGDLAIMRKYGMDSRAVSAFLLVHSVATAWRVYEKLSGTSIGVTFVTTPVCAAVEVRF